MLPMNVFGVGSTGAVSPEVRWETSPTPPPGENWGPGWDQHNVIQEQKISIDLSYLAGRNTNPEGLRFEVEITGDAQFQDNALRAVGETYTEFLARRAKYMPLALFKNADEKAFFENLNTFRPDPDTTGLRVTRDNAGNIVTVEYNPVKAAAAKIVAGPFSGITTFATTALQDRWFVIAGIGTTTDPVGNVATVFRNLLENAGIGALTVLLVSMSTVARNDAVTAAVVAEPTLAAAIRTDVIAAAAPGSGLNTIPGVGGVVDGITGVSPSALGFSGITTFASVPSVTPPANTWVPGNYLPAGDWRVILSAGLPAGTTIGDLINIGGAERPYLGNTTPRADNTGSVDSLLNGQFWAQMAVTQNDDWRSSLAQLSVRYDDNGGLIPSAFEKTLTNYAIAGSPIVMGRAGVEFTIATKIWGNARIIIRDWSGNEVVNRALSTFPSGGLNISYERKISFHSSVMLSQLQFAENRAGTINNGTQTIRLVGPRYYRWHVGDVSSTQRTGLSLLRGALQYQSFDNGTPQKTGSVNFNANRETSNGIFTSGGVTVSYLADPLFNLTNPTTGATSPNNSGTKWWTRPNPSDPLREELYLVFDVQRQSGALALVADRINLNNLWMVAEDRAPMNRDVLVDVSYRGGATTANITNNVIDDRDGWTTESNVAVAYRTSTGLTFSAVGDPLDVRTGTLGGDPINAVGSRDITRWEGGAGTTQVDVPAALNEAGSQYYYRGVETQTVLLRENMPNAWSTSFGTATEFSFANDSVRILGARVWISNAEDSTYIGNRLWGGYAGWAWQGWMNATNGVYPTNINSISLSPDRLRVFIPSQNVADIQKTRELRVTFYLSVEAGYEWKNDFNGDIDVTVNGAGVGNLSEDERTVTVATARDPIRITPMDPIQLTTNSAYFTGKTQIGDIHITENPDMRFDVQDELWVYIIGDGRRQDVTLTADDIAVVDNPNTGLRLRRGYRLHHPQANFWLDGMVYVIERESWSDEPASITIKNVAIAGNIYPGVDYRIVISGPGVAQNDQYVFEAQVHNTAGGQLANLTVGAFYRDPYFINAVEFADNTTTDSGPGTGTQGPGTDSGSGTVIINPTLTLPTLFTNQPTPGGVENPLIFRRNTTNTTDVGFVSVAAFLDLLRAVYGVDSVPTNDAAWDNATQTATIYGPHKQGFTVTVVLTVGSTNVTINGVTMDIADSVGGASGPSGTIRVINEGNRNYLPLRCLAQAFGWVPTLEGNAVTFR